MEEIQKNRFNITHLKMTVLLTFYSIQKQNSDKNIIGMLHTGDL